MLLLLHFMLSACVIESLLSQNSLRGPTSYITNNLITLQNEYVKLVFDQEVGSIISLSSDFHGNSDFGVNLLSDPFKLDIFTTSTDTLAVQKKNYNTNPKHKSELERKNKDDKPNADQLIMEAQTSNDLYVQNWVITLSSNSRAIDIQVSGKLLQLIQSVNHASYSFSLITPSLYGLFADSGVVQMMNQNSSCLGSRDELSRAYFIGNGGALDIVFNHDTQTNSTDIVQERVFHSYSQLSDPGIAKSGLEFVVGGKYPSVDNNFNSAWSDSCWNNAQTADLPANLTWSLSFTLMPNNYNFPVYALSSASASATNLPFTDLSTFLMGLYASPAGCLQSYYKNQKGIIAPTISHPDVGYSPDSNFFDPDNFISLSALMYSGDDYFLRQSRDVIERTAETMCGIGTDQDKEYCDQNRQRLFHSYYTIQRHTELAITDPMMSGNARAGQLMHHFIDLQPTYESIAGSEQLGPNIFWTLSVLRYASLTQDKTWAEKMFPYVDLSTKFILSFIDTSNFLVNAPGKSYNIHFIDFEYC